MKRILLLLLFVLPILVSGQRLKIGKQLEKAPGINYMVLTDINGEQYYTPMSTVLGSINTDQSLGTATLVGNNLVITERNVLTGAITATYTINLAPYMQTLTAVNNGNGTVTLNMTGDPSPELIDICNIVSTHCNSDLTVSATGLVTFTDNAGNNFSFNLTSPTAGNDITYDNGLYFSETVTALSYNPTIHALSYVNEAGATNTITLDIAGLTFNAGTNTLTYTAENGVVTNIVLPADVVTTITNTIAGNRIATYTNENGVAVDIDETITTIVNNGDGTYTFTNEAGATATFPAQVNTDTRLSLSVVNDSLRVDVVNIITGSTVSTSYIDNVINQPDVLTTLAYNSTTHTLTYTDENGGTTNLPLDVATMTYNATTNTITYIAEDGAVTNIALPVETVTTITNTVTGNKIADYTNELGTVVPINETVIGTVNNPDGSVTITKEDGSTFTTVPVAVNGSGSISAIEVSPNVFNLSFNYDCDSILACIPADIDTIVTDFDIVGNTASITLSSGQVLNATITHPADSTVLTTANTNIVVTETSPNNWELEFVYNCDSITNCLADIQLNQFPIVVAGDTISYVTQITGPKGEVVSDTITFPAAAGPAPKPTLTTVTGGTGLPNTATFDNGIDAPTVFNYIEGARNNLQLGSPIVERGNINAGGGQPADFIRDIYNWMGSTHKDHWQSTGDAELVSFKAAQTVNATNTTNTGIGAINIGTAGANGQYKLNVGGAIWLNNGRNSQFIGNQAGENNAMPEQIGIGTRSNMNSSGAYNEAIGFEALMTNTNGITNQAYGYRAMRNANGGSYNTGIGAYTLYQNQGAFNVALGTSALQQNLSGYHNVAVGYQALFWNINGYRNFGMGYFSLKENVSGSYNIGLGASTLQFNISGNRNIAIGDNTLKQLNNTNDNIAIGIQSQEFSKGTTNVSIGNESLHLNKDGSNNSTLGYLSMYSNRYSSNNVSLGYRSMYAINAVNATALIIGKQYEIVLQGTSDFTLVGAADNNTGTIFTATGTTPGSGTTISITDQPNNNTAVGYEALHTTQGFSGNVALGFMAGYNTIGNNRLYIENSADSVTPLIGGNFATDELIIGGVQKFSIQYPTTGAGVSNGSMFYELMELYISKVDLEQ